MNELRHSISQKLEDDFHKQQLEQCNCKEAVQVENIRHMMKTKIIEARERDSMESALDFEL